MPASNPIWCGPGAGRVLAGGGVGTVVAAFGGGGYLRLPGGYVLLAPAGSPRGPLSLLVRGLRAPRARAPVTVWGEAATLTIGGAVISLAGVEQPRPPAPPARIEAAARPAMRARARGGRAGAGRAPSRPAGARARLVVRRRAGAGRPRRRAHARRRRRARGLGRVALGRGRAGRGRSARGGTLLADRPGLPASARSAASCRGSPARCWQRSRPATRPVRPRRRGAPGPGAAPPAPRSSGASPRG